MRSVDIGTWFALPLPSGGWALGLVARRGAVEGRRPLAIFCYFFGPRVEQPHHFDLSLHRGPTDRILFAQTSERALLNGRWIILGKLDGFTKESWPMPPFRTDGIGGGPDWQRRVFLRPYNDDLERAGREECVVVRDLSEYPVDSSYGYEAMEHAVDKSLSPA